MSLGRSWMLRLTLIVGFLQTATAKQTWTVGDSFGWNPSPSVPYDQWAAGKTIQVGDELLFSYAAGQHNVLEVTQSNLASCVPSKPISLYTGDPAIIQLTSAGYHGFISGLPGDCAKGMHLSLQVSPGPGGIPTSSPAGVPAPSFPPRSPSKSPGPGTAPGSSNSPPGGAGSTPGSSPTRATAGTPGSAPSGSTPAGSSPGAAGPSIASSPILSNVSGSSPRAATPIIGSPLSTPVGSPGAAGPNIASSPILSNVSGSSPRAATPIIGSPLSTPVGSPGAPGAAPIMNSPSKAPWSSRAPAASPRGSTSIPGSPTAVPTPSNSTSATAPALSPFLASPTPSAPVEAPIAIVPGLPPKSSTSAGAVRPAPSSGATGATSVASHLQAVPAIMMFAALVACCAALIN